MLTFWLELSTLYFSIAISTNIYTHLYIYTHIHISTIALHLQQPIYSKIPNKRPSPPPPLPHLFFWKKTRPNKTQTRVSCSSCSTVYGDLADVKQDDDNLSKALKFEKGYHEKYSNDKFVYEGPFKKRFCESGGGRKCKALEVREAVFEWFIHVRGVLKRRLPINIFLSKCYQVCD